MNKGCGCVGCGAAVAVGLIIGLIGLSVAGYLWLDKNVLAKEPMPISKTWNALDKAALLKLAPVAIAARIGRESEKTISLRADEMNYILQEQVLSTKGPTQADVAFGDTVLIIHFAHRLSNGKYLNGELRAEITGQEGDFTVKVFKLTTGSYVWPGWVNSMLAKYLEGSLETQTFLKDQPLRITGLAHDHKSMRVTIKTLKPVEPAPAGNEPDKP